VQGVDSMMLASRSLVALSLVGSVGINALHAADCTFTAGPDQFLSAQTRIQNNVVDTVRKLSAARFTGKVALRDAASVPRRNFVDEEIFGTMQAQSVAAAQLSTDEEFLRRIDLDLTGRIPTSQHMKDFAANTDPGKRDALIEQLLASPEFVDKWTVWLGDLLQNTPNALSTANLAKQIDGRNAYYNYMKSAIANRKSLRDVAWEAIASSGNTFSQDFAASNFMLNGNAANGPIQDTYDLTMVKSTSAFLGMAHYDCLSCHSGRGHLDALSSWGTHTTRLDAWRMSSFFSRLNVYHFGNNFTQYTDPLYNSNLIGDLTTGQYNLNITYGNRPARCYNALPVDAVSGRCPSPPTNAGNQVTPVYRDGRTPSDGNWRAAFANFVTSDSLFAINFANRIWKQMFSLGLVDPVDSLDPDRLDPSNPPAAPWTLQATHPVLLQKLAKAFLDSNADLRSTLRILVQSNAYQLSSRYDGDWSLAQVPLFARHYPRRLDGEEVHDAIAQATGVPGKYTVQATIYRGSPTDAVTNLPDPVVWAMQLPDPQEPRSNGGVANFMSFFLRGNRDTQVRSQAGSIQQELALMNDNFVNSRTKATASPVIANIVKLKDSESILTEVFLTFLSRHPTEREHTVGINFLNQGGPLTGTTTAVEDLVWAAINKVDFIFSY
jgi:hypothetical protein